MYQAGINRRCTVYEIFINKAKKRPLSCAGSGLFLTWHVFKVFAHSTYIYPLFGSLEIVLYYTEDILKV